MNIADIFGKCPTGLKGTASAIPFMVLRADQLAVNRVDSPLDVDAVILTHRYGNLDDVVPLVVANSVKQRTRTESHIKRDTLLIIELLVEQMERLFEITVKAVEREAPDKRVDDSSRLICTCLLRENIDLALKLNVLILRLLERPQQNRERRLGLIVISVKIGVCHLVCIQDVSASFTNGWNNLVSYPSLESFCFRLARTQNESIKSEFVDKSYTGFAVYSTLI